MNDSDVENLVQNQDIAPTILELAGIEEKSAEMDGNRLLMVIIVISVNLLPPGGTIMHRYGIIIGIM